MSAKNTDWAKPLSVEEREPKSHARSIRIPVPIEEGLRKKAAEMSERAGKTIGYQTLGVMLWQQWLDAQEDE